MTTPISASPYKTDSVKTVLPDNKLLETDKPDNNPTENYVKNTRLSSDQSDNLPFDVNVGDRYEPAYTQAARRPAPEDDLPPPPTQPWDQITAFLDNKRVFPVKPRKVEVVRNTWVAPADVMGNPSWRAIWEDREKQVLQKDATINGLTALGSIGLGLPLLNCALNSAHPQLGAAAAIVAAPLYFGVQALSKLNKLEEIKTDLATPDDPDEAQGGVKLNAQQVQELQQLLEQQQQQIEQLESRRRR